MSNGSLDPNEPVPGSNPGHAHDFRLRDLNKRSSALLLVVHAVGISFMMASEARSAESEELFRRYCAVCHGHTGAGDGPNADFLDPPPRNLTKRRYVARLTDSDLRSVIAKGGAAVGKSKLMPPWGRTLSAEQIEVLVAYVRGFPSRTSGPIRAEPLEHNGLKLVKELGCTGCHRIGDLPAAQVAPELAGAAGKINRGWLVRFIKAPHRIRPVSYVPLTASRMPTFRLTDDEAEALADYLMSLQPPTGGRPAVSGRPPIGQGERLYQESGCQACHTLEGTGGKVGPDLTRVSERLNPDWVARWIENPQAIDVVSPMPNFGLSTDEARAIARYLLSTNKGIPAAKSRSPGYRRVEAGRRLFSELGCGGCHPLAGSWKPVLVAPDLTYAGDKLKPDWLTDFLLHPSQIRPWLRAQMPDFRLTESEAGSIAAYLQTLKDPDAPDLPEKYRVPGTLERASVGRTLISRDYFSCETCHPVGSKLPEGNPAEWGPNLAISGRRLRPEWFVRWILDPQAIQYGTRMPSFFTDSTSGPEDILDGDEDRQILAIRDYLMSFGEGQ